MWQILKALWLIRKLLIGKIRIVYHLTFEWVNANQNDSNHWKYSILPLLYFVISFIVLVNYEISYFTISSYILNSNNTPCKIHVSLNHANNHISVLRNILKVSKIMDNILRKSITLDIKTLFKNIEALITNLITRKISTIFKSPIKCIIFHQHFVLNIQMFITL